MSQKTLFGKSSDNASAKQYGKRGAKVTLTFFVPEGAFESVLEKGDAEDWAKGQAEGFVGTLTDSLLDMVRVFETDPDELDWTHFGD